MGDYDSGVLHSRGSSQCASLGVQGGREMIHAQMSTARIYATHFTDIKIMGNDMIRFSLRLMWLWVSKQFRVLPCIREN